MHTHHKNNPVNTGLFAPIEHHTTLADPPDDIEDYDDCDDYDNAEDDAYSAHAEPKTKPVFSASDFVTNDEYNAIYAAIKNKTPFEFEKTIKKIRVDIHSSNAGCNWDEETQEGDYIICDGFRRLKGDYTGFGSPYTVNQFAQRIENYATFLDYICKKLSWLGENVKIGELIRQKSLF